MSMRIIFYGLVLLLSLETYAARETFDTQFVHRLVSTTYSYNDSKDSLFISFQFDHPPLLRPHYSLTTEKGIVIEFHGTTLHPQHNINDAPKPVLDINFNQYKIGKEINVTKAIIYLKFTSQHSVIREGNLIIVGISLPEKFLTDRNRNTQIEKLKPNKLMSVSHSKTPTELEVKLNFKRIPQGRVTYRLVNPERVVYDFYNTGNRAIITKAIETSPVKNIKIQNFEILDIKVTRFIVFTYDIPPFQEVIDGNILVLRFKSEGWQLTKQEPLGAFQHKWVSIVMSTLTLSYSVMRIFFMNGG